VKAVKELWQRGVVTEVYKGSKISLNPVLGDTAQELETLATYVLLTPDWCQKKGLKCAHCALVPLYTQRIGNGQPLVVNGDVAGSCTVPGPACSDEEMKEFIVRQTIRVAATQTRQVWIQISGGQTIATSDDTFTFEVQSVPTNESLIGLQVKPATKQEGGEVVVQSTEDSPGSSLGHAGKTAVLAACGLVCVLLACCTLLALDSFPGRLQRRGFSLLTLHKNLETHAEGEEASDAEDNLSCSEEDVRKVARISS